MCILFAYVSHDPTESGYQLILANNRDEEYHRPTKPADWWSDHPHCISGLDAQPGREGGTWMGLSSQGKVGILLNILQNTPPDKNKRGRGHLVTDYLISPTGGSTDYLQQLQQERDAFNGFNLFLLDYDSETSRWNPLYYSNLDMSSPRTLDEEIFGCSNAVLEREWRKVQHGKQRFSSIVRQPPSSPALLTDGLMQLLKDDTQQWPDSLIQQQGTGNLSTRLMQERSAVYVDSSSMAYGTRTHTVVIVDQHGHGTYTESTMEQPVNPSQPHWTTASFTFSLPPPPAAIL